MVIKLLGRPRWGLRASYCALALVTAFFGVVYLRSTSGTWVENVSLSLATNLLASLVVVTLVDQVVTRNQEHERRRREAIALRQLGRAVSRYGDLLVQMYKAAAVAIPDPQPIGLGDLLNDGYAEAIRFLDFLRPAPVVPRDDWRGYAASTADSLTSEIRATIDRYGPWLRLEAIEAIEDLADDPLMFVFRNLGKMKAVDAEVGVQRSGVLLAHESFRAVIAGHAGKFLKVVALCNEARPAEQQIRVDTAAWRADVSPAAGEARGSLPTEGPAFVIGAGPPPPISG